MGKHLKQALAFCVRPPMPISGKADYNNSIHTHLCGSNVVANVLLAKLRDCHVINSNGVVK